MQLSKLVEGLQKEWELSQPLRQDIPSVYTVPLDTGLSFTISAYSQGGVWLQSTIAEAPDKNLEEVYTQLLLGNLFGQGTKGALLGLNENGTQLTLSRTIGYDIDFQEFKDSVEDFINTIDFWREEMMQYR
jgi:hypothetical protein